MIFTVKYSGTFSFLHEGSHTDKHFVESSFCGTDDSSSSCSVDVSGRYILCSGRKKRLTCSWVLKAFASTTVREKATRKLQIFIAVHVFSASFLQKQTWKINDLSQNYSKAFPRLKVQSCVTYLLYHQTGTKLSDELLMLCIVNIVTLCIQPCSSMREHLVRYMTLPNKRKNKHVLCILPTMDCFGFKSLAGLK